MDSEQIKKGTGNEALFNISGPFQPEGSTPLESAPDYRKLKGQVVAQPSEKGVLKPAEHPVDPWEHDSASIEQKLFSDIDVVMTVAISDKIELKKNLSDLYKQAHDLMTRYNQRIQSLLMEDRFLYRHSCEISALMIRGLMPPLEELKTLEKSLTSTRKKLAEEPIDKIQKSSTSALEQVEKVLKDARNRIIKHTKPLKPAQLLQKQLVQQLDQRASELHQQIESSTTTVSGGSSGNISNNALPTIKAQPASALPFTSHKGNEQDKSVESLTSKQLKALAIKLDISGTEGRKRCFQDIISYIASEHKHYATLKPFLSVAEQKCELLSMNSDKACKACLEALQLLETSSQGDADLSLDTLIQVDKAINRLASFDKKIPGEVWQLLTELTPYNTDTRYHLLNLLCRKLLLDGPTPLTQKAVLNRFRDVRQCLVLLQENTSDEIFDLQFAAVYGQIFTSPTQLKKALNTVNKPHEIYALLKVFSRQTKHEQSLLTGALEKLKNRDSEKYEDLLSGAAAFEFLVKELPEKLSSEISKYRHAEPSQTHKQLTQSVIKKYSDYYKAMELAKKQKEDINKEEHQQRNTLNQLGRDLSEVQISLEASGNTVLTRICEEIQSIIYQAQTNGQTIQPLSECRTNIIHALVTKHLESDQTSTIIKLFIEVQTVIEQAGETSLQENSFQPPESITQALASLSNGASPKWYNQLFTSHLQEQRTNTLEMVKGLFKAYQQTIAAPMQIGDFIEASALEITKDNDDPLIKQLATEMQTYAHQLKTPLM